MACGRSTVLYEGDAFGTGLPSHGSVGGSGAHGGTGGTGGRATGGTGGSLNTGGSSTTGGTGMGVGGSVGGMVGVSGGGGMGPGPFACAAVTPTCDAFREFPDTTQISWGSGSFTGGITVWGPGLQRDMDSSRLHVTGTVTGYSGIVIWFSHCSDLSQVSGIQMTLTGTAGPNRPITFQPLTNSDYPWQPQPLDAKGACTAKDPSNAYAECIPPYVDFQLPSGPLFIAWSAFGGGIPVPWNSVSSPREIVGLQWQFSWSSTATPYDVDFTIDDVFLSGQASVDCASPLGGTGGMSGAGGTAGSGGISGSAGATMGGFGGTSQGGSANEGGAAGVVEAGAGGETGTSSGGAPDAGFGGI